MSALILLIALLGGVYLYIVKPLEEKTKEARELSQQNARLGRRLKELEEESARKATNLKSQHNELPSNAESREAFLRKLETVGKVSSEPRRVLPKPTEGVTVGANIAPRREKFLDKIETINATQESMESVTKYRRMVNDLQAAQKGLNQELAACREELETSTKSKEYLTKRCEQYKVEQNRYLESFEREREGVRQKHKLLLEKRNRTIEGLQDAILAKQASFDDLRAEKDWYEAQFCYLLREWSVLKPIVMEDSHFASRREVFFATSERQYRHKEVTQQEGGTCYAHATARCMFALLQSLDVVIDASNHFDAILNSIILTYGDKGAKMEFLYEFLLSHHSFFPDDLRDHLQLRTYTFLEGVVTPAEKQQVVEALRSGRQLIASFLGPKNKIDRICRASQLVTREYRDNSVGLEGDSSVGGHAVVLCGYHYNPESDEHSPMLFMNSWGGFSGDNGCFTISDFDVLNMRPPSADLPFRPLQVFDIALDPNSPGVPQKYLDALARRRVDFIADPAAWFDSFPCSAGCISSWGLWECRSHLRFQLPHAIGLDEWLVANWLKLSSEGGANSGRRLTREDFLRPGGLFDELKSFIDKY
jgi:hypothetical protein